MHISSPNHSGKNADINVRRAVHFEALKCGYKQAILKIFNVHNFWNKRLYAAGRILEVDKKAQTRRRQSLRYRKNKQKATHEA